MCWFWELSGILAWNIRLVGPVCASSSSDGSVYTSKSADAKKEKGKFHWQHTWVISESFTCASRLCGERTHDRIKHSHRCKGHTVRRTASTQSPSFYSYLSGCSHLWVGLSNSCWYKWRCRSRSAPSHWPRCAPAGTILKRRRTIRM